MNVPCLALSSLISRATSSNLAPLRIFSSASSFFECFSHKMCLTLMLVAGLSLLLLSPASFESPESLPFPLFFGAMLYYVMRWCDACLVIRMMLRKCDCLLVQTSITTSDRQI